MDDIRQTIKTYIIQQLQVNHYTVNFLHLIDNSKISATRSSRSLNNTKYIWIGMLDYLIIRHWTKEHDAAPEHVQDNYYDSSIEYTDPQLFDKILQAISL